MAPSAVTVVRTGHGNLGLPSQAAHTRAPAVLGEALAFSPARLPLLENRMLVTLGATERARDFVYQHLACVLIPEKQNKTPKPWLNKLSSKIKTTRAAQQDSYLLKQCHVAGGSVEHDELEALCRFSFQKFHHFSETSCLICWPSFATSMETDTS